MPTEIPPSNTSYFQQEQWFELRKIYKGKIKGHLIVNSYGKVREIYEDGTYRDMHNGQYKI